MTSERPNPSDPVACERSAGAAQAQVGRAPSPPWPRHVAGGVTAMTAWLCRPRVRLTVLGVMLIIGGALLVSSSIWTLPLVIGGALMVMTAWVGHRLDGRLAVEWGDSGARFEFRAQIRAEPTAPAALADASPAPPRLAPMPEREPDDADVVEGEAHTVEIEVAALSALIAAAETAEGETAQAEASAQAARILRVAHGGGRSSEAGR